MPDPAVIRALLGRLGRIGGRIIAIRANLVRPDRRPAKQPAGFAVFAQAFGHRAGKVLLKTRMMFENRQQLLDCFRGPVARRKLLVGHEHRQHVADFMPGQGGRGGQGNRETSGKNGERTRHQKAFRGCEREYLKCTVKYSLFCFGNQTATNRRPRRQLRRARQQIAPTARVANVPGSGTGEGTVNE